MNAYKCVCNLCIVYYLPNQIIENNPFYERDVLEQSLDDDNTMETIHTSISTLAKKCIGLHVNHTQ